MFALERQKKIMEFLQLQGGVLVNDLSRQFGVTEETVRRDLEKLENQGLLVRTHGGAVPYEENTAELSLDVRKKKNIPIKEELAKVAQQFIVPGDTIFLDASTTTFCLAKRIKQMSGVTVITNSLRVLTELAGCDKLKVISVGGVLSSNMSFVGSMAEEEILRHFFVTKMFFSSKGVTKDAGVLESNEQESHIKSAVFRNCKQKFYMCDDTKIGQVGFIKLAPLEEIDTFITNAVLDKRWQNKLEECGVKLVTEV